MITVQDVLNEALPAGTRVVAGEAGLAREVTWATRLRSAPPAFEHLSGGEVVMLPPHVLEELDERLTLADAIQQLASFNVAAISVTSAPGVRARENGSRGPHRLRAARRPTRGQDPRVRRERRRGTHQPLSTLPARTSAPRCAVPQCPRYRAKRRRVP